MRRFVLALLVGLALSVASVGSALAHVHAVTPLECLTADNEERSGASGVEAGPIEGFIPRDVGEAPLGNPSGGKEHSQACEHEG